MKMVYKLITKIHMINTNSGMYNIYGMEIEIMSMFWDKEFRKISQTQVL